MLNHTASPIPPWWIDLSLRLDRGGLGPGRQAQSHSVANPTLADWGHLWGAMAIGAAGAVIGGIWGPFLKGALFLGDLGPYGHAWEHLWGVIGAARAVIGGALGA